MNLISCWTMFYRELLRFWRVGLQTLATPIISSGLYLLVLGSAIPDFTYGYGHITYREFLIPGLLMMTLQQNAFANTASSITQSKVLGNIIFLLHAPLSMWDWFIAYVGAAVVRGLLVAFGLWLVFGIFVHDEILHIGWVLAFAILGAILMGSLGFIAGLWAEKFDHLTSFQNFVVMPLTFLSGVFYTINHLPPFWQRLSLWNPCFYMIDGVRYGFFGVPDVSPWFSLTVTAAFTLVVAIFCLYLLKIGYKLKN